MIITTIDLELNQLNNSPKIIQIGACAGNTVTGEIIDSISIFVNPHEQLTDFIINLTGITQEQADNGYSLKEAYDQLVFFHKKNGAFCNLWQWGVGDAEALKREYVAQYGQPESWPFGRRFMDVKMLYQTWKLANQHESMQGGLKAAMRQLKVPHSGRGHDALVDARHTFYVFIELMKKLKENKCDS